MRLFFAVAAAAVFPAAMVHGQYTVTDLTPVGATNAQAYSVSGTSQAGAVEVGGNLHAYLWNGGAPGTDLHGDLPGSPESSQIINLSSTQGAGYVVYGGIPQAGLWTFGSPTPFQALPQGVYLYTQANAVAAGNAVGVGSAAGVGHAVQWPNGAVAPVDLHPLTGYVSSLAFSTDGTRTVGTASINNATEDPHAALWTPTVFFTDIHPSSGFLSSNALSIAGNQVVGYGLQDSSALDAATHALLWTISDSGFQDIHPAGFASSMATGTNGSLVVGYATDSGGNDVALLWDGGTTVDLAQYLPAGTFVSSQAFGIDSQGNIVGTATDGSGNVHAILWEAPTVSVPEPASVLMLAAPALWALGRRRR